MIIYTWIINTETEQANKLSMPTKPYRGGMSQEEYARYSARMAAKMLGWEHWRVEVEECHRSRL